MRRKHRWLPFVCLGFSACPATCETYYFTTSENFKLSTDDLASDPCQHPGTDHEPLLVGTRWCPETMCELPSSICYPEETLFDCHEASVTGPAEVDGTCLRVTGAGAIVWQFLATPCDRPESKPLLDPDDEEVHLRGVTADEVQGTILPFFDREGSVLVSADRSPGTIPTPADDEPLKLVADAPVHLAINLHATDGRLVAWNHAAAEIVYTQTTGPTPMVVINPDASIDVTMAKGSASTLALAYAGHQIPLRRLEAVAVDDLQQIEVLVGFQMSEAGTYPTAARAIVRDSAGDLVYGAPVTWSVTAGSFPLTYLIADKNLDYSRLTDEGGLGCFVYPRVGTREYTGGIAASFAGLRDEVLFNFTAAADEKPGLLSSSYISPNCSGPGYGRGCGCQTSARGPDALAALALLLFATRRRRKHQQTTCP